MDLDTTARMPTPARVGVENRLSWSGCDIVGIVVYNFVCPGILCLCILWICFVEVCYVG